MSSICTGISHSHTLDGDLQFNHKTPTRANKNAELRFSQTPCLHLCRTVLQALLATAAGRRSAHARPWVPAKPIKKHTNAQPSSCCRLLVACCKNPQASRELKRLKLANSAVESPAPACLDCSWQTTAMHTGPLALQKLLVAASRAHAPAHATASGAAPSLDGRRQPLPWSLGVAPGCCLLQRWVGPHLASAQSGACAAWRRSPRLGSSPPLQLQKQSTRNKRGETKIQYRDNSIHFKSKNPGGHRRKGPPFPSNSNIKLKDPWRISNPRKKEGGETRTARERDRRATSSLAPGRGELAALLSLLTPLTL